jgi:hypothetical protein
MEQVYNVLPAIDAIRLLKLHPIQQGNEICCTVETTCLSANPTYCALSYEWGEAKNKKSITLNGQQVRVRENLWRSLSRLRHAHDDRVLWVDAICINQDDVAERNQQVQIMAQIYESAASVWIWLGEDTGGIGHIFQSINSAQGLEDRSIFVNSDSNFAVGGYISLRKAVTDLSRMTYFTRTWIIQEVILARELVLFCGEHSVDWDVFWKECNSGRGLKSSFEYDSWRNSLFDTTFNRLAQARERRKEYASIDGYASLMSEFGSSQCTDVRDKVYGLLGLLPEYRDRLRVDYTIAIPVLYFRTLSLFEEYRKVVSAEHLRISLGLAWPQLCSVPESPSQAPSPSTTPATDSPTSIRVSLTLEGPVTEVERRRQLVPHGPGSRQLEPSGLRRRYFTFRVPHRTDVDTHTYGLSASRPLPGDTVQVFLETRAAVIFRKIDGGKLISVGGATMSATFRECLSLLTKAPDHARLGVLQDGLFSGVEAREGHNGVIYMTIAVQALEKVVTSSGAV